MPRQAEDHILTSLRAMAWERAKGELRGLLQTYWSDKEDELNEYRKLADLIDQFIKTVNDEHLE